MLKRICSGCGSDVGYLKLTWIKEANLFFCPDCYGIFEEWMAENRLKILAEVTKLRVLINAGNFRALLESAVTNKDATGE
jgi:hypothetical protein